MNLPRKLLRETLRSRKDGCKMGGADRQIQTLRAAVFLPIQGAFEPEAVFALSKTIEARRNLCTAGRTLWRKPSQTERRGGRIFGGVCADPCGGVVGRTSAACEDAIQRDRVEIHDKPGCEALGVVSEAAAGGGG